MSHSIKINLTPADESCELLRQETETWLRKHSSSGWLLTWNYARGRVYGIELYVQDSELAMLFCLTYPKYVQRSRVLD